MQFDVAKAMTSTEQDLERARTFFESEKFIRALDCLENHDTDPIVGDIASLIAQLRAETLNDIVKLLQSVLLVSSHKDGIDINKIQTTTQIISIIEAMIPQAQEDKEHE